MLIKADTERGNHSVTVILKLVPAMRQFSLNQVHIFSTSVNRSQGSPLEIPGLIVEAVVIQHCGRRQAESSTTPLFSFKTDLSLMLFRPFLKDHGVLLSTGKSVSK